MLSELELKVIWGIKIPYFGAYLQACWFDYPELKEKICKKEYPSKDELEKINEKMKMNKCSFDIYYQNFLSEEPINPLKIEQEAWNLLSSKIEEYLINFNSYTSTYSPDRIKDGGGELTNFIEKGYSLLKDWNTISNSYKMKQERVYDKIEEKEADVKRLINKLS